MKSLSDSSLWLKLSGLGLCVALLFHIIGFATTSWTLYTFRFRYYQGYRGISPDANFGLWRSCASGFCGSMVHVETWLDIVRGLECIGLIGLIVSSALILANIMLLTNQALKRFAIFTTLLAGTTTVIGCIYYAIKMFHSSSTSIGYSYFLCLTAGGIALLMAVFLSVDVRASTGAGVTEGSGEATASEYPPGPYPGRVLIPPPSTAHQQWAPNQPAAKPAQQWIPGQPSTQAAQQWVPGQSSTQPAHQWASGQPSCQPVQQWPSSQPCTQPVQQPAGQSSTQPAQKWAHGQPSAQPAQQWSSGPPSAQTAQQWSSDPVRQSQRPSEEVPPE